MFKFFSELSDENRIGFRTIKIMVFISLIFGFWGISNDSYAETLSHKHSSKHTHHTDTKKNISKHKVKKASQSTHQKKHPHNKAAAHTNKQSTATHHGNSPVTHTHSVQKPSEPAATPAVPTPAPQEQPKESDKGSVTGQPLPRFSALRADEVNMRAGPGMNYPILWVYHRRSMPVKILREFDVWRLIEDQDGQKGWVQGATLVGNRTFIVKGSALTTEDAPPVTKTEKKENEHTDSRIIGYISDMEHEGKDKGNIILRKEANDASLPIAVLKPGVVGLLKLCPTGSDWCKVSVKQYSGWLRRDSIWGLLPQEVIQFP